MKWNDKEIEYLEDNYGKLEIKELENNLNRSEDSIRMKAWKLNLTKKENYSFWTEKEIEYLKNNYESLGIKDIINNLNRSKYSIRKKTFELNLIKEKGYSFWNEKEIEYLIDNYRCGNKGDLIKKLCHSWQAIKIKACKLNLTNVWTREEIEYMRNNYSDSDIKDLENNLNHSKEGIKGKACELNLTKKQFLWDNKEIEYLMNNYSDNSANSLKLNLNHSWDTIKTKANSLGLKRNRLAINEDFFKYWNKEMAYIFGFWVADGCMTNGNSISFANNDLEIIQLIKFLLDSKHKINNYNNSFKLEFRNNVIYDNLLKLGGTPRKSLTIQFPEVPDECLSHFIRGEFDGDGCFYIFQNKYLNANFVGNVDFLTVLKDKIKEQANLDSTGFYSFKNCNPRIRQLIYNGKKGILLGDYMYRNSENLRLERKFKIYNQMKKEYIKRLEN